MTDQDHTPVTCSHVETSRRLDILPRYAGRHMLALERLIYQVMGEYEPDYKGAHWSMWELSNGGFYMAPGGREESYAMQCVGNWFDDTMSADAAGIVACLVAFNRLAWHTRQQRFIDLYHQLRDFALEHDEATKIMAAID